MSTSALMSTAFRTVATAVRGEQVVGMLLYTVPLAERMLLYHVAVTAWAMVPESALRERLGLSRHAGCAHSLVRTNPKAIGS